MDLRENRGDPPGWGYIIRTFQKGNEDGDEEHFTW
jgi:hypothetical protein